MKKRTGRTITAIILCGLLALQTMMMSGCAAQRKDVAVMMEGLDASLKSLEQQSLDASAAAQASEAASVQASQEFASAQASEAASMQASQAAFEAASIQASQAESQAIEAASIQASQAESEAASIQASEVQAEAEAASIQASEAQAAAEVASIRASEAASQAASIQTPEGAQDVVSQPPAGHEGPWVGGRKVYLTFDDGPSYLTPQVLDILDRYQVKATFFVTYTEKPELVPYYNEMVKRGHTIAIHTASHEYNQIYASMEAFTADFDKIYNYVRDLTGVNCQFYRFPGGSSTGMNLGIREDVKAWLNQRGIVYHDWNVVTGDGGNVTTEEAYRNVVDNILPRTHPVILLHDGVKKETTVEALPRIIETLKSWGFVFAPIDSTVQPIQQGVNW